MSQHAHTWEKAQARVSEQGSRRLSSRKFLACLLVVGVGVFQWSFRSSANASPETRPGCNPRLPNFFERYPIRPDNPVISSALAKVDAFVRQTFRENDDIDALTAAVVTSDGAIYEISLGPLRANETEPDQRGLVDRHSIFRIASGSKLFAALEILLLRKRGALRL
jgi:CubicO group peptidase (beta-lactamase class C family)